MTLNQQTKKGTTTFGRVVFPDYCEEIELPQCEGSNQDYVWDAADPLGCLYLKLCLVIKVHGR